MHAQTQPSIQIDSEKDYSFDDLNDPKLYLNRELTWLNFNERVLYNATDDSIPLIERVKFLAIVGSNLDEFFMKRIGGLYQQVYAGFNQTSVDGRLPEQQISDAIDYVSVIETKQREALATLSQALRKENVKVKQCGELTESEAAYVRQFFADNIYPLVTPQSIDPAHPFPFVSNLSINLLVSVRVPDSDNTSITRIKIPISSDVKRFIVMDTEEDGQQVKSFIPLEDVIRHNLDILLPGMEILDVTLFRVTRNAITEKSEEQAEDLLELIEAELRERRFAPIVRLQIEQGCSRAHQEMLIRFLGVDASQDVYLTNSLMGTRDLMELLSISRSELRDKPHSPVDHPLLVNEGNIFQAIRKHGSILLHHPYISFSSSVERFLHESSRDESVLAIKMTLYRTSSDSKIIKHLIAAAQNGKQVAVVMEIKATFDESANIRWAQHLEQSGIHVTYGIVGLKTHCKVIHVVRREKGKLMRYSHIGTGNYHSGTARLYTDLGKLTNDQQIGSDLTELFNYLTTGYTPKRNYQHIAPAPKHLKPKLIELIDKSAAAARDGKHAVITLKANALEDQQIVSSLYYASSHGVTINLIIRDTCRLRPGLPNLSENITVRSVVGRFLEHSRVFMFEIGDKTEIFFGSADLMKRNLESRVEVLMPVLVDSNSEEIKETLAFLMSDNVGAWEMQSDGSYIKVMPSESEKSFSAQRQLIKKHDRAHKESQRLKLRKTQSIG